MAAIVRLVVLASLLASCLGGRRVRREIRTLTDDQRQAVFSALRVMKRTPQEKGESRYGRDFMNYDQVVLKQFHAVVDPRCDQAHMGPALVTYNRALALLVERSVLAIDPEIEALPYWDYSIQEFADPAKSVVWSDDFFGESHGDGNDQWMIRNGPFKDWHIANASELGENVGSPLGYLRGLTNMLQAPRITRGTFSCGSNQTNDVPLPGDCAEMDNFTAVRACLDKGPSGFAHLWLGGVWGAEDGNCRAKQAHGSIADRVSGCMACPPCRVGEDCRCHRNETACAAANATGICQRHPCSRWDEGRPLGPCLTCPLCADGDLGSAGDYYDAATSPNDPIFWFHYLNVDRLFMHWQVAKSGSPQAPLPYSGFPTKGLCPGHLLPDVMSSSDPFTGAILGWTGKHFNLPLTNADLLEGTVPFESSPYTYDTLKRRNVPIYP